MRDFFVLAYEDRDDLQTVADYEMCGFNLTHFWNGKPYFGPVPDGVKLFVCEGRAPDLMANPVSWIIASERLRVVLSMFSPNDLQCFAAPLFHQDTQDIIEAYSIINLTLCIDALASDFTSVSSVILVNAKIPTNVHFFRLVGHERILLVSRELASDIRRNSLQGLHFIGTRLK